MTNTLTLKLSLTPTQGQQERALHRSVLASTVHLLQHVFEQATSDDLRATDRVLSRIGTTIADEPDQAALVRRLTGGRVCSSLEQVALETSNLQRLFASRHALLGGAVPASEVARLLGVSRQTVYERARKGTLLAVEEGDARRFPAWQFDPEGPRGIVAGLPDVLRALPVSSYARALWLMRPNPTFEGRTPLETLKAGERERVLSLAASVGAA